MSTSSRHAADLFKRAALADDDLGYPDDVVFIADDIKGGKDIVGANMANGIATVIVSGRGGEVLLSPDPRRGLLGLWDRLRGQVRIRIGARGDLRSELDIYGNVRTGSHRRPRRRGADHNHAPARV